MFSAIFPGAAARSVRADGGGKLFNELSRSALSRSVLSRAALSRTALSRSVLNQLTAGFARCRRPRPCQISVPRSRMRAG